MGSPKSEMGRDRVDARAAFDAAMVNFPKTIAHLAQLANSERKLDTNLLPPPPSLTQGD